jgi:hypothetical protein
MMSTWKRAGREQVRIFFTQNQHIAIVIGKKPRTCAEIELVEMTQNPRVPILSVQCRYNNIAEHAPNNGFDSYCLVKPVIAGPIRPYVTLLHRDGSELIKVESIHELYPARTIETLSPLLPELLGSAIGFSQNYSLDEAFKDALQKLRLVPSPASDVEPSMVDVVSMGAVYGGFSGYSRMFVRIEQSRILKASTGPSKRTVRVAKGRP